MEKADIIHSSALKNVTILLEKHRIGTIEKLAKKYIQNPSFFVDQLDFLGDETKDIIEALEIDGLLSSTPISSSSLSFDSLEPPPKLENIRYKSTSNPTVSNTGGIHNGDNDIEKRLPLRSRTESAPSMSSSNQPSSTNRIRAGGFARKSTPSLSSKSQSFPSTTSSSMMSNTTSTSASSPPSSTNTATSLSPSSSSPPPTSTSTSTPPAHASTSILSNSTTTSRYSWSAPSSIRTTEIKSKIDPNLLFCDDDDDDDDDGDDADASLNKSTPTSIHTSHRGVRGRNLSPTNQKSCDTKIEKSKSPPPHVPRAKSPTRIRPKGLQGHK